MRRHVIIVMVAALLGAASIPLLTSSGSASADGIVPAGGRRCFGVSGSPGDAAVVNLTPVEALGAGNGLLVSSDVVVPPVAANVNYRVGSVDPNVAVVPIGADGEVCFENAALSAVHLVADQLGSISGDVYEAVEPSGAPRRVLDTRELGVSIVAGGRRCFGVSGSPGDGAVVNLTPVEALGAGNGLLVSSDVVVPPVAANVNYRVGSVDPNVAVVPIGADGEVCFENAALSAVHLVADQLGSISGDVYEAVEPSGAPRRVLDTRELGVSIVAGGRRCFGVSGSPGDGAVVNLTPVEALGAGNGLLVSSDVVVPPVAANVNYRVGSVDPNVAVVPIGADGEVCFENAALSAVHLVADQLGSITAGSYEPARSSGAPQRVADTRLTPTDTTTSTTDGSVTTTTTAPSTTVASTTTIPSTTSTTLPGDPPVGSDLFPLGVVGGELVDGSGGVVYLVGDAAWSLVLQLGDVERAEYFGVRRGQGFNTLLVNLVDHMFADDPPFDVVGNAPFVPDGDFGSPQSAYFERARDVIAEAGEAGFVVLLVPAYLGYEGSDQGWYQDMVASGPGALRSYGEYVGGLFAGLENVVWVHGGDYTPPVEGLGLVRAVSEGIVAGGAGQVWTSHWAPETSGDDVPVVPLDFNTTYTYEAPYVASSADAEGDLPHILLESKYEDDIWGDATPQRLRSQAYQAVLTGAAGYIYGHGDVWQFRGGWEESLVSQGAREMSIAAGYIESIDWSGLVPDVRVGAVVAEIGNFGDEDVVVAAATPDRSLVVAYVPDQRPVTINLAGALGTVQARWFDPTTGTYTPATTTLDNTDLTITHPGPNNTSDHDWILEITNT